MNFVSKLIKDLGKEYKQKEAQKSTIELLYITRTMRKGQLKC